MNNAGYGHTLNKLDPTTNKAFRFFIQSAFRTYSLRLSFRPRDANLVCRCYIRAAVSFGGKSCFGRNISLPRFYSVHIYVIKYLSSIRAFNIWRCYCFVIIASRLDVRISLSKLVFSTYYQIFKIIVVEGVILVTSNCNGSDWLAEHLTKSNYNIDVTLIPELSRGCLHDVGKVKVLFGLRFEFVSCLFLND